ncbi:MAG TPA: hypothetical protein VNM37_03385 [Candidatus Dormibacteraeota bacterium]|nr:hypothetical protein [Candidatus Dormibacteraeota bacterium]
MFDPAIKAQWLTALRSGQYPQIKSKLHTTDGYCCLGVLCEQLPAWQWQTLHEASGEFPEVFGYTAAKSFTMSSAIAPELAHPIGLDGQQQTTLMEMNDSGQSFTEIADWIEANL